MPPPSQDWSNLPRELLDAISRKIVVIADYLRFRAVCPSWRSASSPRPPHLPPQAPWLLLPFDPSPSNPDTARFFFSPPHGIHTLHLPDTRGLSCRGSSRGCLVLQAGDGPTVCLLNPITRTLTPLPPLNHLQDPTRKHKNQPPDYVIRKAVLSSNPSTDPHFVVFLLFRFGESLVFCRGGDVSWTVADLQTDDQWFVDVVNQDRTFFAVSNHGRLTVYDLASPSPSRAVIIHSLFLHGEDPKCLVVTASRELLIVVWDFWRHSSGDRTDYGVLKLSRQGQPEWVEVDDIGEEALLLVDNGSHSHCLAVSCTAYSGLWRRNCMYYAFPHHIQPVGYGDSFGYGINLFRLEDSGTEQVVHDLGVCSLNWPPALWFTPSLC